MSCLIVERHEWETGAGRQQVQIPRDAFRRFFGSAGTIDVDIYGSPWLRRPTRSIDAQLSEYRRSGTYRLNRVFEIANLGAVFILLQDESAGTGSRRRYALWWERDVALVAARFNGWQKARDSQYGRGRVWTIIDDAVSRPISW